MVRGRQAKKETKPRRVSSRSHADPDVIVAIQDSKRVGGVDHYLVKWSQATKKDSWEPAAEVKKVAKSLIAEFEENQSRKYRHQSTDIFTGNIFHVRFFIIIFRGSRI